MKPLQASFTEFSMTTTTSDYQDYVSSVDEKETAGAVIKFTRQEEDTSLPKGYINPSDLLAKLITSESDHRMAFAARKQIADDFYINKNTLAAIRLRNGLSQRELAKKADLTQSYIARIENGRADPGHRVMKKLSSSLHVDMNELSKALT